ncbi:aspartate aminotransferase family protein [Lentibacillus salicampi]|nr:acetylornithine transaminase [Lentibacillus salicampi]
MTDWQELDKAYVMPTYSQSKLPIAIEKGEGSYLYDTEGNRYLDLFGGLAVNVLGHSHPEVVKTLKEQGEKFLHISNIYLNQPAIQLAKTLVDHSIRGKVFFANSGAEATEAAVKLIHKWRMKHAPERNGIVVLEKSFHGRTLGALKLTRQPGVQQDFPQPDFEVIEVEKENLTEMEKVIQERQPLAVLMEPVLGSGGILPLSEKYLQEVEKLCRQYEVLFCMDEIQTGMGRTSKLFAYQHAGVSPDLILFAKGIGGGLPLSGIIAGEKLENSFSSGDHGTTFAPSPLSAALGNTVLRILLEEGQLQDGREKAIYLWDKLTDLKEQFPETLASIRGRGMMIGIVSNKDAEFVAELRKTMVEKGFLIDVTQKTIIRLLPPLTLTEEEIDTFIAALQQTITELISS